jgi:hypothetical protein
MPITDLTVQGVLGPYPALPLSALALAIAFAAADVANGNKFPITGKEVIIAFNSDSSAHTITLSSAPDALGRSGDIASYGIPATSYAAFAPSQVSGWKQSDGTMHISANDATVKFAILRLS